MINITARYTECEPERGNMQALRRHVKRMTKNVSTNAMATINILSKTKHVVDPLFVRRSLSLTRSFVIISKFPSIFIWASSTTARSLARYSEKCIAFRFNCVAICASCSESSCCNAFELCRTDGVVGPTLAVAGFVGGVGVTGSMGMFGECNRFALASD
jgi:hypothetical protein